MDKRRPHILIAEDDFNLGRMLKEDFEELLDTIVILAEDGSEAYRKARNQKFDAIVTDFKMPKVTGAQLISALRESSLNEDTPIIIFTGYAGEIKALVDNLYKGLTFVSKPTNHEELCEIVKSQITRKVANPRRNKADASFLNVIIDSVNFTLTNFYDCEGVENLPAVRFSEALPSIKIAANLSILSHYFNGVISLAFSEKTYLNIISKITEKDVEKINQSNMDFAAEILSVTYGHLKKNLAKRNLWIDKVIPNVLTSDDYIDFEERLLHKDTLAIHFNSSLGEFYLLIHLISVRDGKQQVA